MNSNPGSRKPGWLRVRSPLDEEGRPVLGLLRALSLHTVCEEASCPNREECFASKTATFMILGNQCTRNCTFCTVSKRIPCALDPDEPRRVAEAVRALGLTHAVVTSVTRDDLPDGGAGQFARVIRAIRAGGGAAVEVLIPDFQGSYKALMAVLSAGPDVLAHNIEAVPRLYPEVRPMADYARSLELLARAKRSLTGGFTKSGLMVGLGETHAEVLDTLHDLRWVSCDILTIGQYLAPSKAHHPVVAFITPEEFERYRLEALDMGFRFVASAPLVRSSFRASEGYERLRVEERAP